MNKQNETSEFLPPCQFQNGESVRLRLGHHTNFPCRILATKSTAKFVYYDLEVWLYPPAADSAEPLYTRLYHIESKFLFERDDVENSVPRSIPEWVGASKRLPKHNKLVAARYGDGDDIYNYSSLAREENSVFIGEETMYEADSPNLENWEWLDEN